jgi:poly(3-hydroxyalkanoate) depolymerase
MARRLISLDDEEFITDEIVTVGCRRLRVQVRRPRRPVGPPLLVINGIGAALDLLDPFVDALSGDREIIRFDPPGIGGSPDSLLPYHVTTFAPVVGDLVARLGHDRVDVLGYSWGGTLAQQLAIVRPKQVRRLVLVATTTGALAVPASPRVLRRLLDPRWPRDPATAQSVAAAIYGGTVRTHPERAEATLTGIARSVHRSRRGYALQLTATVGWTSLPLLRAIRARTLVIAGDDDPIIPSFNATILSRGIPDARLHRHPGGHLAIITEAPELAAAVAGFLSEPEPWSAARARTRSQPWSPGGIDS